MDHTTAIAYLNKFGGTVYPYLNQLMKQIWIWCLDRNMNLLATHFAGTLNVMADEEYRVMMDRTDWMLCPHAFQDIN